MRECAGVGKGEKEGASQADFQMSSEPDSGADSMSPESTTKPKPRVGCSTD